MCRSIFFQEKPTKQDISFHFLSFPVLSFLPHLHPNRLGSWPERSLSNAVFDELTRLLPVAPLQVNGLHLDFSSRGPASHRAQVRALLDTLDDAVALHGSDRFLAMREAAMTADVSWEAAAAQWEAALAGMMAGGGEGGGGRGAEGSESAAESVDD